jgi:hypothetical protein
MCCSRNQIVVDNTGNGEIIEGGVGETVKDVGTPVSIVGEAVLIVGSKLLTLCIYIQCCDVENDEVFDVLPN